MTNSTDTAKCDTCGGEGTLIEFRRFPGEYQAGEPIEVECHDCSGTGELEAEEGTPVEQFNAAVDREIARQGLTEVHGDPLLKRRRAA